MKITLENMKPEEAKLASSIALASFAKIESEGFSSEGKAAFVNYVSANAIASRQSLGHNVTLAVSDSKIVGMIEIRNGNHISMLFVLPEYTNNGIGTKLLTYAIAQIRKERSKTNAVKQVTVHSADGSLTFYLMRGFRTIATRQERDGIGYTTMAFSLKDENAVDRKIRPEEEIDFFAFSGTGNTYYAVERISSLLRENGVPVRCHKMEKCMNPVLSENSVIGIAFPVACFSTYPTVLDFLDSLPEANGNKIFMIATMGGAGMGMEGPIRRLLAKKGYSPIASKLFVMPGNYGNKKMPEERNAKRISKFENDSVLFTESLIKGNGKWRGSWPFTSNIAFKLGHTRKPWNLFYRMFSIQVNQSKCTICGKCVRHCPRGAIKVDSSSKFPQIDKNICQSCQRCIGFCPQHAIEVPKKPAEQYTCMSYDEFVKFGEGK
ncbi:MAG: EFR1 family ferrodoxin [Synergistaceae bacterium]|nr:EFR1 family ferrodoxin [Synergistaceae bacterium]